MPKAPSQAQRDLIRQLGHNARQATLQRESRQTYLRQSLANESHASHQAMRAVQHASPQHGGKGGGGGFWSDLGEGDFGGALAQGGKDLGHDLSVGFGRIQSLGTAAYREIEAVPAWLGDRAGGGNGSSEGPSWDRFLQNANRDDFTAAEANQQLHVDPGKTFAGQALGEAVGTAVNVVKDDIQAGKALYHGVGSDNWALKGKHNILPTAQERHRYGALTVNTATDFLDNPIMLATAGSGSGAELAASLTDSANIERLASTLDATGNGLSHASNLKTATDLVEKAASGVLRHGPAHLGVDEAKHLLGHPVGGAKLLGSGGRVTVISPRISHLVTRPLGEGLRALRRVPGLEGALDRFSGEAGKAGWLKAMRSGDVEKSVPAFQTQRMWATANNEKQGLIENLMHSWNEVSKKLSRTQLTNVHNTMLLESDPLRYQVAFNAMDSSEQEAARMGRAILDHIHQKASEVGLDVGYTKGYVPGYRSDELQGEMSGRATLGRRGPGGRGTPHSMEYGQFHQGDEFLGKKLGEEQAANGEVYTELDRKREMDAIAKSVYGDQAKNLFNANLNEILPNYIKGTAERIKQATVEARLQGQHLLWDPAASEARAVTPSAAASSAVQDKLGRIDNVVAKLDAKQTELSGFADEYAGKPVTDTYVNAYESDALAAERSSRVADAEDQAAIAEEHLNNLNPDASHEEVLTAGRQAKTARANVTQAQLGLPPVEVEGATSLEDLQALYRQRVLEANPGTVPTRKLADATKQAKKDWEQGQGVIAQVAQEQAAKVTEETLPRSAEQVAADDAAATERQAARQTPEAQAKRATKQAKNVQKKVDKLGVGDSEKTVLPTNEKRLSTEGDIGDPHGGDSETWRQNWALQYKSRKADSPAARRAWNRYVEEHNANVAPGELDRVLQPGRQVGNAAKPLTDKMAPPVVDRWVEDADGLTRRLDWAVEDIADDYLGPSFGRRGGIGKSRPTAYGPVPERGKPLSGLELRAQEEAAAPLTPQEMHDIAFVKSLDERVAAGHITENEAYGERIRKADALLENIPRRGNALTGATDVSDATHVRLLVADRHGAERVVQEDGSFLPEYDHAPTLRPTVNRERSVGRMSEDPALQSANQSTAETLGNKANFNVGTNPSDNRPYYFPKYETPEERIASKDVREAERAASYEDAQGVPMGDLRESMLGGQELADRNSPYIGSVDQQSNIDQMKVEIEQQARRIYHLTGIQPKVKFVEDARIVRPATPDVYRIAKEERTLADGTVLHVGDKYLQAAGRPQRVLTGDMWELDMSELNQVRATTARMAASEAARSEQAASGGLSDLERASQEAEAAMGPQAPEVAQEGTQPVYNIDAANTSPTLLDRSAGRTPDRPDTPILNQFRGTVDDTHNTWADANGYYNIDLMLEDGEHNPQIDTFFRNLLDTATEVSPEASLYTKNIIRLYDENPTQAAYRINEIVSRIHTDLLGLPHDAMGHAALSDAQMAFQNEQWSTIRALSPKDARTWKSFEAGKEMIQTQADLDKIPQLMQSWKAKAEAKGLPRILWDSDLKQAADDAGRAATDGVTAPFEQQAAGASMEQNGEQFLNGEPHAGNQIDMGATSLPPDTRPTLPTVLDAVDKTNPELKTNLDAIRQALIDHPEMGPADLRAKILGAPMAHTEAEVEAAGAVDSSMEQVDALMARVNGPDWADGVADAGHYVQHPTAEPDVKPTEHLTGQRELDNNSSKVGDPYDEPSADYVMQQYVAAVKRGDLRTARTWRASLETMDYSGAAAARLEAAAADAEHQVGDAMNLQHSIFTQPQRVDDVAEAIRQEVAQASHHLLNTELDGVPAVVDGLNALRRVYDPRELPEFLKFVNKVFDGSVQWLKAWEVASPGFHSRNFFGNLFQNFIAGVHNDSYPLYIRLRDAAEEHFSMGAKADTGLWGQLSKDEQEWAAHIHDANLQGPFGRSFLDNPDSQIGDTSRWLRRKGKTNLARAVDKAGYYNPLGARGPVSRWSVKMGAHHMSIGRGAMMADTLSHGGTVDEAIARINKFHFDYGDLSHDERVLRKFVPFYTFTRHNLPLQIEMLFKQPGKYAAWQMVKHNLEAAFPHKDGKGAGPPDYFSEGLFPAIRIGGGKEPGYEQNIFPSRQLDDAADPVSEFGGMLSPIIRQPLEAAIGQRVFKAIPVQGKMEAAPLPLQMIPGVMQAFEAVGVAKKGKHGWEMNSGIAQNTLELTPILGNMNRMTPNTPAAQLKAQSSTISYLFGIGYKSWTRGQQKREAYVRAVENLYQLAQQAPPGQAGVYYDQINALKARQPK